MQTYQNIPSKRLSKHIMDKIQNTFKGLTFEFDTRSNKPFSSEIVRKDEDTIIVSIGQIVEEYALMYHDYAINDIIEDVISIINNGIQNGWDTI